MTSDEQYVEFVHARAPALLRTACLLTAGDRSAAEQLVQTALPRAYAGRRRTRTPAATEAYVRRILVRAAIRRRLDRRQHVDLEGEPAHGGGPTEHVADRPTILDALRALPAQRRAVVVLRYYDGLSDAQIAEALGHSPETVSSHRSRALDALRELVEPHIESSHQAEEQPLEGYLHSSMEAATDQVRGDHAFVARVLEESQRLRRQRRTRWLGGGVVAMVAIVSASLASVGGSDDTLPEPEPVPPVINMDPIVWARQLPQGPPTQLAYVVGNTLHAGDQRIPLPGDAGEVIGTVPDGWLVAVQGHEPSKGGLSVDTAYGIVTPDGTFQRLPRDPYGGSGEVRALSPNGDLFATGGALIDLASRRVVGRTPEGATYASEWTPTGLLYETDADGSSWLWRPGGRPIQLPAAVWEAASAAPRGLSTSTGDCTDVVDLRSDGGVVTVYKGCAADRPMSLSPSGTYVLTVEFAVRDTDELSITEFPGVPRGLARPGSLWWEDDDHLVVSVEARQTATQNRVVLVRCSIATTVCERASAEFTMRPWQELRLE